jgi:hypothetical protein
MGYACPVCEDPQADGEHLANHLAFTAVLGDADHEDWLDEHAPGWGDTDPQELAERVSDHAEKREFPQVFEDTTSGHDHGEGAHGHGGRAHRQEGQKHGHGGHSHGDVPDGIATGGAADPSDLFDERGSASNESERDPSDVLAEARELTERRRANDDEGTAGADGESQTTDSGGSDRGDGSGKPEGEATDGDETGSS